MAQGLIGVDIGTTSTKAVLFSLEGQAIATAAVEYPLYSEQLGMAEQDPEEIFRAVLTTVRQVVQQSAIDPLDLLGISFSAAMHSLIAIDSSDQTLTRSITWADNRAADWAEQIKQSPEGSALYARTGTPIHPMSPLVKLCWLRESQPALFAQAAKFVSIKEFVCYRWFGRWVVDHSIASATGLLNLEALDWDAAALALAGIKPSQLSELVPTTHCLQGMATQWAQAMGIGTETPIVVGASDGVLSNLGVGAIDPGVVAVTIGTSGAVRAVVDRPTIDPQQRLFCYALAEKHWVVGGPVNNGGVILRWVRDQISDAEVATAKRLGKDPYEMLLLLAETIAPGSDGLLFYPYLLGERSPLWDANARGAFVGLSINHGKAHLVRSVLEGILFNLSLVLKALEDLTGAAKTVQATGGFARSALWRQMMADIFNQPIAIPEQHESSCLGAVILALYALGKIDRLAVDPDWIGATHRHQPQPAAVQRYQQILPVYAQVLSGLTAQFGAIAQLQQRLEQL